MRTTSLGLALILGGIAASGCTTMDGASEASASAEFAATPNIIPSFTLHVSQDEDTVDIRNNNDGTFNICQNANGCDFPYLSGTPVTLTPFPVSDRANCVQFRYWTEDCSGSTCNLTMDSNKSVHAYWIPIKHCIPE